MKGFCGECDRRYACDIDQDKCDEWPDPVPITNADRIRSMSDEELKEFICSNSQCKFCKFEGWGRCELLEWLQQPVKENDYAKECSLQKM